MSRFGSGDDPIPSRALLASSTSSTRSRSAQLSSHNSDARSDWHHRNVVVYAKDPIHLPPTVIRCGCIHLVLAIRRVTCAAKIEEVGLQVVMSQSESSRKSESGDFDLQAYRIGSTTVENWSEKCSRLPRDVSQLDNVDRESLTYVDQSLRLSVHEHCSRYRSSFSRFTVRSECRRHCSSVDPFGIMSRILPLVARLVFGFLTRFVACIRNDVISRLMRAQRSSRACRQTILERIPSKQSCDKYDGCDEKGANDSRGQKLRRSRFDIEFVRMYEHCLDRRQISLIVELDDDFEFAVSLHDSDPIVPRSTAAHL